jgi:ATP-dependent DNA helicase 2 subunit 2
MASKKAYIFVLDLGSTLGECHNGRSITDLDWGMQWAWDKMATIMSRGLKGDNVGVVGFRTDDTSNPQTDDGDDDGAYDNIAVLKELGPLEIPDLRSLQDVVKPSSTDNGDVMSALIVAIDKIEKFTTLKTGKPGKFERYIYLLTDGQGSADPSDLDDVAGRLKEIGIELTVMWVERFFGERS